MRSHAGIAGMIARATIAALALLVALHLADKVAAGVTAAQAGVLP